MTATLRVNKQKKLFKGVCVHHGALEGKIFAFPVKELARQVTYIRVHTSNVTTMICEYWNSFGRGCVADRDMRFHMKFAAAKVGCPRSNIEIDRIDTHLNRAGGACVMKLEGFDDESIRKMGGWLPSPNAFLE